MNYTIQSGDTLSSIAGRYGTTWQALWALNSGALRSGNPNVIYPGEVIMISSGGAGPLMNTSANSSSSFDDEGSTSTLLLIGAALAAGYFLFGMKKRR